MMAKMDRLGGGYYNGECEGSGSSGRIDVDISKDSNAVTGRCGNLYTDTIGLNVHLQAYRCSGMSSFERKNLVARLKVELEEVRSFWKIVEMPKTNGSNLSSTSDILSCGYRQNGQFETLPKTSMMKPNKSGQKPDNHMKECNRGMTGRFYSGGEAPSTSNAANAALMKKCETMLKKLIGHQYGWVFKSPVDVVKLNIPDYFTIIKSPMDLGTVKKNLSSGTYPTPLEFFDDVKLTFSNAMTYNPPGNDVHIMADTLNKLFESQSKDIRKKLQFVLSNPISNKPLTQTEISVDRSLPPTKKRKLSPELYQVISEPVVEQIMSEEEKHKLSLELEAIMEDMPISISDFLRQYSSCGIETGEDEIEIDIDALSDDILFTLRKLLDDHFQQKSQSKPKPCEIEVFF